MAVTSEMIESADPSPPSEMILTDGNSNSELKVDFSSQPPTATTSQSQQRPTPVEAFDPPPEEQVVVSQAANVTEQASQRRRDDESRGKPKKRKRRRGKRNKSGASEMSPPTEEQEVLPENTNGSPVEIQEQQQQAPLIEEPDDEMPMMNGGHLDDDDDDDDEDEDEEPDFEVVEPMPRQLTEEEVLEEEVNAFDCTQSQSIHNLQRWINRLQNDYDKSFAQMFYNAEGVEKVVRSMLLNPTKCACDNEIVKLFNETLLGPRDYHAYLFQETKRLAVKLVRRESIRDEILLRIEEIISTQKHQPQSSAPEIERQVFEVPSKHWVKNASCPSFDMWQSVDNQAMNLQEKHNQLREGKLHTRLKQPNSNPQVLHSLKLVDKLAQDGTARLAQRELNERSSLNQFETERKKITKLKETKIQPLETQLTRIRNEYEHYLAQKRKLERDLSQINSMMTNLEQEERDLEEKIQQENDFGMKEQILSRKIDERKIELAIIGNESKCFNDLRAIAMDIYQRLDAWSNQQISDQQELHDGLAQSYLNQLLSFMDQYNKILQFFRNRVTFAHELIAKRQAEQKEAAMLYGREKTRNYEEEITRYKRQEDADQKTADLIRRNMYSYIDGAQEVVRDTRFNEFIYHLQQSVGGYLDVSKYIAKTESRRMLNSGIEKRRRETGSQTTSRDYPSRGPKPSSNLSMTTQDLSIPRTRNNIPVMTRGRSGYSQTQATNRVNSAVTPSGVSAGRQPTVSEHSTVRGRGPSVQKPVILPQFSTPTFPTVMGMRMLPQQHQHGMMQQSVSANLTMVPRAPMQGQIDMETARARRHHGPIVGPQRRAPRFDHR